VDDETWARKVDVVRRALARHQPDPADPVGTLAAVGGLEHAALAGFVLGAAALRVPVVLDGVIACAAALAARALAPEAVHCLVAGHLSTEPGAGRALTALGLRPLLQLDMRLGEGSGGALALPILQSAARVLRDVATFDSAGVSGAKE
jgi:nicotinate-nucleotide--dimethylbenzimidazole phosphoribosyltransferase